MDRAKFLRTSFLTNISDDCFYSLEFRIIQKSNVNAKCKYVSNCLKIFKNFFSTVAERPPNTSLVIKQKSESRNRCYKKTNHAKFFEKWTFLTPWHEHVRIRFALMPYYRRLIVCNTREYGIEFSIRFRNKFIYP